MTDRRYTVQELVLITVVKTPFLMNRALLTTVFAGAMLLAAACNSGRKPPGLPTIELSRFQLDIAKALEQALIEAKANSGQAEPALRVAMLLHAHDQFQAASQAYSRAHFLDARRFDVLYCWSHALASNGAYSEAVTQLRQALTIRPDHIPALLKLAEVLRESGDAAQAAEIYKRILSKTPDEARAHYGLGRTLQGEAAAAEFREALHLFPRYGAAQFALAAAYRRQGDEAGAQAVVRDYERDKTLLPPLNDPEMAAVRALNLSANAFLQRAGEQEIEGRFDEALALYQRAIAADPKLTAAYVNMIPIYGRLHRDNDAEEAYRKAVSTNPNAADAYYNFGVLCFERGRGGEAKAAFRRAVELQANHAGALHNLGFILEGEGRWEQAANLYRRAVGANPDYPLAYFHLGRIYANQKKYALAIEAFGKSLAPESESTPAYLYALAATHARAGNPARAAELMRTARVQAEARRQHTLVASIDRDLPLLEKKP
jgi:tetratricopeptide (TPR) repeat protein